MLVITIQQQRLVISLILAQGKLYVWGDSEYNKDFTPSTKDIMTPL